MNQKQADVAVGVLLVGIVALGGITTFQFVLTDGPMGGEMGSTPVMAMFGPLLMSLFFASVIGGVYMYVRDQVFTTTTDAPTEAEIIGDPVDADETDDVSGHGTAETGTTRSTEPEARRQILDVLPDDERRVLEPVIESPGLTQTAVCDRSGFSRSKVSQTITGLEERGLLYREPQGRTYRVYPADDLDDER